MTYLQQLRLRGFFSSSTRLLLLLSLYFSWFCPAEPAVAVLQNLGLIAEKPKFDPTIYPLKAVYPLHAIPAPTVGMALACPEPVPLSFMQVKQRENGLPPSTNITQISAHRPRSACIAC